MKKIKKKKGNIAENGEKTTLRNGKDIRKNGGKDIIKELKKKGNVKLRNGEKTTLRNGKDIVRVGGKITHSKAESTR